MPDSNDPAATSATSATSANGASLNKTAVVVGAGLVGAVQALLLARMGFDVTVVEKRKLRANSAPYDSSRTVVLSHRSWQLLSSAGLWPDINSCPIKSVHVTQQGKFGSVRLHARSMKVEALGYVLSNPGFEAHLHGILRQEKNVKIIETAKVRSVDNEADRVKLNIQTIDQAMGQAIEDSGIASDRVLDADLVIAADGTDSTIREMLGISTKVRDYQQFALLANINTERPHQNIAFERFTEDGPLALLPLSPAQGSQAGRSYSMIITAPLEKKDSIENLSDEDFLAMFQKKFGGRLGRFSEIGKRVVVPLKLTVSAKQVDKKVVLIGNAARTLHPVAGQGMNLAMRDVFELASCLSSASSSNTIDLDTALIKFQKHRQQDQSRVTSQTDFLARAFTQKSRLLRAPVSVLGSASFVLLDIIGPAKKTFASMSMGNHVPLADVQSNHTNSAL